eukprot:Pgem_evm1s8804
MLSLLFICIGVASAAVVNQKRYDHGQSDALSHHHHYNSDYKPASQYTAERIQESVKYLNFNESTEFAEMGLIWRRPSYDFNKTKHGQTTNLIDSNPFINMVKNNKTGQFYQCPSTVNPSTWKQASLMTNVGKF